MYKKIASIIQDALPHKLITNTEIEQLLERPKYQHLGDIAFPCFTLAKSFKKAPDIIAIEIGNNIKSDFIQEVHVVGGYINLFLNKLQVTRDVMAKIMIAHELYGQQEIQQKNIVIDFSSPNIAKPFSMGHLRSTVIGNALANIAEKNGYNVIRVNHLGDWGTQFGKLLVAFQLWGEKERVQQSPIEELLKLYVKFHDEAETNKSLNEEARSAFKALEDNDPQAMALWTWFKSASLQEFKQIYEQLHIQFDTYEGEAFYNEKMQSVVDELKKKQLLTESDGANVVELEDMPPCLITKQDGATLYATRDLAAAFYRQAQYEPSQVFYVVGNEQTLHFKQVFQVISKMGYPWSGNLKHVPFGMMLKDGKKMSTRKGRVILLKDVLKEAVETASRNIEEKNPTLNNKQNVADQVGIGAVIFNDLKNFRLNDIEFSLPQMLNFEGETGPYVQYTHARIHSILEKAKYTSSNEVTVMELENSAWEVIKLLQQYPQVITDSFEQVDPSLIAKYVLQLARIFNKYYANTKILVEDEQLESRLQLCFAVATVLKDGLKLLGIKSPESM
ncbi:Arginine--tRNA ligase [Solibacillus isronensis B3W22]|uniref:Arginine--tRNA ligase n=1 Tax=Solibacillus isronensis B3W22 TaxID=1224748 RepID=K1L193_9BACL|nr:arginine--tRNA ligase [Solibacillus isronensis]AMO85063.1 arginine--tRNA ligase [Solibacillus silvestris]EKB45877.1 Arginine--tRNA ligase [Solibacillus isronensis B3W22]